MVVLGGGALSHEGGQAFTAENKFWPCWFRSVMHAISSLSREVRRQIPSGHSTKKEETAIGVSATDIRSNLRQARDTEITGAGDERIKTPHEASHLAAAKFPRKEFTFECTLRHLVFFSLEAY